MSEPTGRQLEMIQRVSREEANDRRTIMRVQIGAALALLLSTLLAWEQHPQVVFLHGLNPGFYISETHHSIGVATRPAGLIVFALGVLILALAVLLKKVRLLSGWLVLVLSLGALATCAVETGQLMFGRRDWLDHLASNVKGPDTLGAAVGGGVWLATLASVVLVASVSCYAWLNHYQWRNNPAVRD